MSAPAPPRTTPLWITTKQAAQGWGVSHRHARRIIAAWYRERRRKMSVRGKIRTADFLAIPRGDMVAAPMVPEVRELQEKVDELTTLVQMLGERLARHERAMANGRERTYSAHQG